MNVCVLQAQQMTMQAIAIQQQMLSSFPPAAPAPQSPPSQPYHAPSPVSRHVNTQHVYKSDIQYSLGRNTSSAVIPVNTSFFLQPREREESPYKSAAVQRKTSMFYTLRGKLTSKDVLCAASGCFSCWVLKDAQEKNNGIL